jgi:glycine cleavage system H protein
VKEEREMDFPSDLKYSEEHEWVRVEGSQATVGITQYAQEQLGDIVYVELPEPGSPVEFMETFGVVESVKAASELFSPISGNVLDANATLEDEPELVNQDPYVDGWMIVVEMTDPDELEQLMDADAYEVFVETLED